MRILWTFVKVVLALALAIPVSIIVLAFAFGTLVTLVGLAFLMLKLAVAGVIAWGVYRLIRGLLGGPAPKPKQEPVAQLHSRDPHYDAAMRELDRELGT